MTSSGQDTCRTAAKAPENKGGILHDARHIGCLPLQIPSSQEKTEKNHSKFDLSHFNQLDG